jgi:hypothetical protein
MIPAEHRARDPGAVLRLLLGFKRATEVAQRQVTKVLDGMIARGRLLEENNHVSVKE